MLLEGSTENAPPNELPLAPALDAANIHHFLVGAQSAMPVDSVGNPWSGSYVYNSGNLVQIFFTTLCWNVLEGFKSVGCMR